MRPALFALIILPGILQGVPMVAAEITGEKANDRILTPERWSPDKVLNRMTEVMGKLPISRPRLATSGLDPLELQLEEEVDCGSYVRRRISYQTEPGNRVPAYLLVPKLALGTTAKPVPAVLCLHPTNQELGAKVVVGLGGAANRAYALELAERGFVTLAPCYPTMGGYAPELERLGYQSGTMKAIADNVRGLDVLDTLPFVKHGRYGAIGHSLGGHNAIFTAAFEPRIAVIVSSCGFDSFRDYYGGNPKMWEPGKGWTQQRYMPRLAAYAGRLEEIPFDFHELIALLAPRAVFVNAPLGDTNFQWRSVERMIIAARPLFRLHNVDSNLEVVYPDCGHDFPDAVRQQAYRLLEKHLR
jgi:dienelactone hydrolase